MYEYRAKILRVVDGDTVHVDIDLGMRCWRKDERIRLSGIDAPELRSPDPEVRLRAQAAKNRLIELLALSKDGWVHLSTYPDPDSFGRWIAWISLWDAEGNRVDVSAQLVAEGHAVWRTYG